MLTPQRILVLGSGGSGKTTFSRQLAATTQLPLYHLDALYWKPGWSAPDKAQWQRKVAELVEQPRWIMDGSYGGTLTTRVPKADLIVFLDMSKYQCIWNILKRRFLYAKIWGKIRPGMPAECPETLYFSFLKWVWQYPEKHKPKVLETIAHHKNPDAKVLIFNSYSSLETYLLGLKKDTAHQVYEHSL